MCFHSYFRAGFSAVLTSIALNLALSSCAKPTPPPPPPKPTVFQVGLAVASNVNPDSRGRASPIVARLFELKSLAAFQSADFLAIFDRDKESLGNELVAKEELILQPGENRKFTRELHSDTRFVAVVAGYRDLERSRWRASVPVLLHDITAVTISVQENDISIIPK
jgi:type VI secretion system protein VasD